jgi:hypothetical protein
MQVMLNSFLFKRPDWFKHEGYWRLAQVFRLAPTAFLLVSGIVSFGFGVYIPDGVYILRLSLVLLVGGIVYLVLVHWLLRLLAWIVDGFRNGSKP